MTPEQQELAIILLKRLTNNGYASFYDNYDDIGTCTHCRNRLSEKHEKWCPILLTQEFLKGLKQ